MKVKNANVIRENLIAKLLEEFALTEDVGMIASNSFNFPIVAEDGEEGWVEIVVKIPKDDEGYEKRSQYDEKVAEKKEKAIKNAEAKAKKIAKDKALREKKAKEKEEK